jgi:hypothetical protein
MRLGDRRGARPARRGKLAGSEPRRFDVAWEHIDTLLWSRGACPKGANLRKQARKKEGEKEMASRFLVP